MPWVVTKPLGPFFLPFRGRNSSSCPCPFARGTQNSLARTFLCNSFPKHSGSLNAANHLAKVFVFALLEPCKARVCWVAIHWPRILPNNFIGVLGTTKIKSTPLTYPKSVWRDWRQKWIERISYPCKTWNSGSYKPVSAGHQWQKGIPSYGRLKVLPNISIGNFFYFFWNVNVMAYVAEYGGCTRIRERVFCQKLQGNGHKNWFSLPCKET